MKRLMLPLFTIFVISLMLAACTTPTETAAPVVEEAEPAVEEMESSEAEEAQPDEEDEAAEVEEAEPPAEEEAQPTEEVESEIDGATIYTSSCAGCHAPDRSGRNGPPLLPDRLTDDASAYVDVIVNGRGGMPSFSGRLSAEEIDAVVSFILSEPE